jgi:hypothetical protein
MPYKVFTEDNRYCVHKKNPDGSKGKKIGCHDSRGDANKQMSALYAAEKESATLFTSFLDNVQKSINTVKSALGLTDDEEAGSMLIWKDKTTGKYMWLTRYSNNFRDEDNPPEIIAEASHRRFVKLVDNKEAPMPELWLWHVPEWKLGEATWLAYDDSGFALSAGYFSPGLEKAAEWLSKQKFKTSHGMPVSTIKRDPDDSSIIVEHISREISALPSEFAANTRGTNFIVLEEAEMAIPKEKRDALIEEWNIKPELLDEIERLNAAEADKAVEEDVERKETTEEDQDTDTQTEDTQAEDTPDQDTNTEPKETEEDNKDADKGLDGHPTRGEITEALENVVFPVIAENSKGIGELATAVKELKDSVDQLMVDDEEKIKEHAAKTPAASMIELMARSAVKSKVTVVQGDDDLVESKPKETEPNQTHGRFGIPIVDGWLSGSKAGAEDFIADS